MQSRCYQNQILIFSQKDDQAFCSNSGQRTVVQAPDLPQSKCTKSLKFCLLLPVSEPFFLLCIYIIEQHEVNYWFENSYSLLTSQREKDSVWKTNFVLRKAFLYFSCWIADLRGKKFRDKKSSPWPKIVFPILCAFSGGEAGGETSTETNRQQLVNDGQDWTGVQRKTCNSWSLKGSSVWMHSAVTELFCSTMSEIMEFCSLF